MNHCLEGLWTSPSIVLMLSLLIIEGQQQKYFFSLRETESLGTDELTALVSHSILCCSVGFSL